MYCVYVILQSGRLLLAAATALPLTLESNSGRRMEHLLLWQHTGPPARIALSLRGTAVAHLLWEGARLLALDAESRTIGPLLLIEAATVTQDGVRYALLSRVWVGAHLIPRLLLARDDTARPARRRLTGWSTAGRAAPISVALAATEIGAAQGYLIWGGDAGLRAGGRGGFTRPAIFTPDVNAIPAQVRRYCAAEPPNG